MELRHLRYFVAVAEELNFRRAAERVRVAQPALSKQIKDLEHDVGVKLLERNTARVSLTDGGRVFLAEARGLLTAAERAVETAREAAAGRAGHLTVANVAAVCSSFMPATLAAFHARYPEVDVDLREVTLTDQFAALDMDEVNVGFMVDDMKLPRDRFDTMKVLAAEVQVALPRNHRLARRRRVPIAELAGERILCIETGKQDLHRERIRRIFERRGMTPGRFKHLNSYESLQAMVEGGQGVSFLASIPRSGGQSNVVFRELKEAGDDMRFALMAVWRRGGESKLAENFVRVLQEVSSPRTKGRKKAAAA